MITLVTGGARSGKSDYALRLVRSSQIANPAFIATAEAFDDEMRERIARHRRERPPTMPTIEAPIDLAGVLRSLPPGTGIALIDCLTVWLGNLMHHFGPERETYPQIDELRELLEEPPCNLVFVTNEIGMGLVPDNAMARRFRDLAGHVNCFVAAQADRVILMISGIPVQVKPTIESGRHP